MREVKCGEAMEVHACVSATFLLILMMTSAVSGLDLWLFADNKQTINTQKIR